MRKIELIKKYDHNGYYHIYVEDDLIFSHRVEITSDTMIGDDGEPIYVDAYDWAYHQLEGADLGVTSKERAKILKMLEDEYYVIVSEYTRD